MVGHRDRAAPAHRGPRGVGPHGGPGPVRLVNQHASRADILIDGPTAAARSLWPSAGDPWRLAVGEVKTTDSAKDAYDLLSKNQAAVLVPLATTGGTMSRPLAGLLDWGTRTIAPGQASSLLVFRVGHGDFLRMPLSLRSLLKTHSIPLILDGSAGTRNAQRMATFLKTVVIVAEPVK